MTKRNKFEDYLEEVCFSENPTILDDDGPDFFDNWISGLDSEDWLKHGDNFINFILE